MNVGVLLITHPGVATALRNTARNMLGQCYLQTAILEVPLDAPIENIYCKFDLIGSGQVQYRAHL